MTLVAKLQEGRIPGGARALVVLFFVLLATGCAERSHAPAPGAGSGSVEVANRLPAWSAAEWSRAVVYFAIVDRFADGDPKNNRGVDRAGKGTFHGGDLAGLASRLDDLAELGINTLWLTPTVRNIDGFVTGAGFPDWGYHGYWADDFEQVDPRFGTEAELRHLVAEAHRRGIRVLLDVVYNHAGYGSHYLTDPRTASWLRSAEKGSCGEDDLTQCVAGLPDFRTDLPEVREYLLSAHLGLAKRVGLDGFRLDTVKHVEHDFWKLHRTRTRQELGAGFFLLGEVWGGDAGVLDPWFAGDELDAGFDFGFQGSALAFVRGRGRAVAFDRYLKSRERVRPGYLLAHFLSSHDVPGALYQLDGDLALFRLAAFLQMTVSGIPVVYYGEEVGRRGGDWPDNRSDMPWGALGIAPGAGQPRDEQLRSDYRRLIALRARYPELATGAHESLVADGDLLVFGRHDPATGSRVVVAVNRGAGEAEVTIPLPADWRGAQLHDVWGERPVVLDPTGEVARVSLAGRSGGVLVRDDASSAHPNSHP
ncbi:MAG: DUF3459 domain-containing protein [Holophagales bacterium]|nr:MAG: DUF3459 domain-containing protein [Holophagales bacterium]